MRFNFLNRYVKILASYAVGNPLYAPDSVSVMVSNRCNLRCVMCEFWENNKSIMNSLGLSDFENLFRDLTFLGVRIIQFTGGEPFLRSDLITILKAAKKSGLETAVVTNATLINENSIFDFVNNVDTIYISLDSPFGKQHENVRGVRGIFEKIIKTIEILVNTIKENHFSTRIILCSTITSESIHDPRDMVSLAKKLGINGIIYNPASFVSYSNTRLKGIEFKENRDTYCNMVDEIIKLMAKPSNIIRSNPFYLLASKKFLNGNSLYYKFPCFGGGYNGPLIGFDGEVFPCCAWNISLGNIKEKSFSKIWNSQVAKDIRLKIKRGQCPVCYHHTRTFDFLWRAPILFRDPRVLFQGYKMIGKL